MKLKNQRTAEITAAQTIVDTVKAANRELNAREQETLEGHFKAIEKLDADIARDEKSAGLFARVAGIFGESNNGYEPFDNSGIKEGLTTALNRKQPYAFNLPVKAALTGGALNLPSAGSKVSASLPGTTMTALRDMFPTERAESGNVRYYQMGSGTAEVVAEGGLKPDAGITVTPVDDTLKKIATTFGFTDELIEDASFLVGHIQTEALRGVLAKENELIVTALDTASGAMTATGTAAQAIDVLAEAIGATTAANGVAPSQALMNPIDFAKIRTAKGTGSGDYAIDPLSAGPATIHGVNVLATPAVAQGTMYLVSAGAGVFYTRQDTVRVDVGYSSDDWMHNRLTGRAEERVLPAVIRPSLVTKVTLTA